jgi:hypothetical protein
MPAAFATADIGPKAMRVLFGLSGDVPKDV